MSENQKSNSSAFEFAVGVTIAIGLFLFIAGACVLAVSCITKPHIGHAIQGAIVAVCGGVLLHHTWQTWKTAMMKKSPPNKSA